MSTFAPFNEAIEAADTAMTAAIAGQNVTTEPGSVASAMAHQLEIQAVVSAPMFEAPERMQATMLSFMQARNCWLDLKLSRVARKVESCRRQRARRKLKNLASLRVALPVEYFAEIIAGWSTWDGPKTRVPRSLVLLLGETVGR